MTAAAPRSCRACCARTAATPFFSCQPFPNCVRHQNMTLPPIPWRRQILVRLLALSHCLFFAKAKFRDFSAILAFPTHVIVWADEHEIRADQGCSLACSHTPGSTQRSIRSPSNSAPSGRIVAHSSAAICVLVPLKDWCEVAHPEAATSPRLATPNAAPGSRPGRHAPKRRRPARLERQISTQ